MMSLLSLFSLAIAGSITLEVTTTDRGRGDIDLGQVSLAGGSAEHVVTDLGTYLVMGVTATAHWTADTVVLTPSFSRQEPLMLAAMTRPQRKMTRPDARDAAPTHIDLYVQSLREQGDSDIWVGATGTAWHEHAGTRVTPLPTLVVSGVPLNTPHRHELAMALTRRSEGLQLKEIVYTAIVP